MTQNQTSVTISIPNKILKEIEERRGDISRSRYILRLVQTGLALKERKSNV